MSVGSSFKVNLANNLSSWRSFRLWYMFISWRSTWQNYIFTTIIYSQHILVCIIHNKGSPLRFLLNNIATSLFDNNWLSWQIVSDDKIQIELLILRRSALSTLSSISAPRLKQRHPRCILCPKVLPHVSCFERPDPKSSLWSLDPYGVWPV